MRRLSSKVLDTVCDGCGKTFSHDLVKLDQKMVEEIESIRRLSRELYTGNGQFQSVELHACSTNCLVTADLKFETRRAEAMEAAKLAVAQQGCADGSCGDVCGLEQIDLSSLQVNKEN